MVGGAFIANRHRGNDEVPGGNARVQDPGTPAHDERAAPQGDDFLEQRGRERRAHAGLHKGDTLVLALPCIDGVASLASHN
jgi:hypothetical protein